MICAYAAIGLFMSSLTAYQVVAAVGTLAVLAVLITLAMLDKKFRLFGILHTGFRYQEEQTHSLKLICSEDFLYSYWSSPSSSPFRSCAYRQNVQNVPPHKTFSVTGVLSL